MIDPIDLVGVWYILGLMSLLYWTLIRVREDGMVVTPYTYFIFIVIAAFMGPMIFLFVWLGRKLFVKR